MQNLTLNKRLIFKPLHFVTVFFILHKKNMADITKCTNQQCKEKESCKRFTVEPSYMQYVCKFEPINGVCDFKIQVNK